MFLLTSDSQFDLWIVTHESWIRSDRLLPKDPQPYKLICSFGQVKFSLDKYIMAIYLSLVK